MVTLTVHIAPRGTPSQSYVGAGATPLGIVLSGLDTDHGGTFDADAAEFFAARLWTDRNLNGSVDLGELWSLTRFGIDHISLTGVAVSDGERDDRDAAGKKIAWEAGLGINGARPMATVC